MFPGWGFARRKGGLPKPVLKWFNHFVNTRNNTILLKHRLGILTFGAACYRAGYRAAQKRK